MDFPVAIAAVNRLAAAGFEGDFGLFAATGTCGREHLALAAITAAIAVSAAVSRVALALRLSGVAAFWTAFGLVGKAFVSEELLLGSSEGKICPTVGTIDGLVLKTHWMTSSLYY